MSTDVAVREPPQKDVSWGEVDWMIEVAISKMRGRGFHPRRIIPIGGGGLIPASIMAYRYYKKDHLLVDLMAPLYAKSYDHQTKKQHRLSVAWPADPAFYELDDPYTLFVDDICDTGVTLWSIRERMPKSSTFAVVTKKQEDVNWYGTHDIDGYWWNFPWEK